LLSFATNHAPHVHLVKASPRTGAKAGRRFSEKEKKTTGFLRGNGNRSFQRKRRGSGQLIRPANHKKKRRDQFMTASKSGGLDVPD